MTLCKKCKGLVRWVQIQGRWHCHNADGSDHWDTCSARRWRQVKETGQRFENAESAEHPGAVVSGYANSIHGTKLDRIAAKKQKSKTPIVPCGDCVPPWEVCPNACPNAIQSTQSQGASHERTHVQP